MRAAKAASRLSSGGVHFFQLGVQHKVGVACLLLMRIRALTARRRGVTGCPPLSERRPAAQAVPAIGLPPSGVTVQQRDSAVFGGNRQRLQGQHGAGGCVLRVLGQAAFPTP